MGIVTAKGDKGRTFLLCGGHVSKDDPRIEACGALDELSSFLGLARSVAKNPKARDLLLSIQKELFIVGYEFTAGIKAGRLPGKRIGDTHIRRLEDAITSLESVGKKGGSAFCIPGDNPISGILDVARTVARRAERRAVTLERKNLIKNGRVLIYLNRLSDLLYLMARQCGGSRRKSGTKGR